jgi:hypothetical protein
MSQLEPRDVGPRVGGDLPVTTEDRDLVRTVLDAALGEGQLDSAEHARRCQTASQAVTFDDLIPLTRDLSGDVVSPLSATRLPATAASVPNDGSHATLLAVFSGFDRRGGWTAPAQITSLAVFGGGKLDLSEAVWTSPVIEVTVAAVFGAVDIWVPPGTEVLNNVVAVLGGATDSRTAGPPNNRRLIVKGVSLFGSVTVKTKPRSQTT